MWWWVRKPDFAQAGKEATEVIRTISAPKLRKPSTTSLKKCWSCHRQACDKKTFLLPCWSKLCIEPKPAQFLTTEPPAPTWQSTLQQDILLNNTALHPGRVLEGRDQSFFRMAEAASQKKESKHLREQARVCSYCRIITCSPQLTCSETRLNGLLPWKWVTYESTQSTVICLLCRLQIYIKQWSHAWKIKIVFHYPLPHFTIGKKYKAP